MLFNRFYLNVFLLCYMGASGCRAPTVAPLPPQKELQLQSNINTPFQIVVLNTLAPSFTKLDVSADQQATLSHHPLDPYCSSPSRLARNEDQWIVLCSLTNQLQMYNLDFGLTAKEFVGNRSNPMDFLWLEDGTTLVTSWRNNTVLKKQPGTDQPYQIFADLGDLSLQSASGNKTQARPSAMVVYQDKLFVALSNLSDGVPDGPGYVAALNVKTGALLALIQASAPNTVHLRPSILEPHQLYVVNAGDFDQGYVGNGSIDRIDMDRLERVGATSVEKAAPFKIALSSDGRAFVSNAREGTLFYFEESSPEVIKPFADARQKGCAQEHPQAMSYISDIATFQGRAFALEFNSNCLLEFDQQSGKLLNFFKVGSGPESMVILPSQSEPTAESAR